MFFEAQHISKSFGTHHALTDVTIQVEQQSIFGLLGPNGAGKSTLLRIINHITAPDSGTLLLDGRPMQQSDIEHIGYMPEERGLYKKMKVGEQALYLAQLKGLSRRDSEHRLRLWFEKFEISDWWNRKVEELSKGMQQKVQFIVTVLHEPRLLIFDEPFSGFDPVNATLLKNEILQLRKNGATVIFSTHNMASVEEICDDIALINQSQVVLQGSVQTIRESYRRNIFLVCCRPSISTLALPSDYVATLQEKQDDREYWHIQVPQHQDANQLLQHLLPQRTIISFNEILPSMNDIFIQTVK